MWVATTDEEANFIFDILADRDASEPMLAYARWLEEQGEQRAAEFLRYELAPLENEARLKILRGELDTRWVGTVTSRRFRRGDDVRITGGTLQGIEGRIIEVDAPKARAELILHLFYHPTAPTWVAFSDLEVTRRGHDEQSQG